MSQLSHIENSQEQIIVQYCFIINLLFIQTFI